MVVNTVDSECSGVTCLEQPQEFTVTRSNMIPHPNFRIVIFMDSVSKDIIVNKFMTGTGFS